ncbi:alpha-ketoacid dehydrogenase subunit beta [Pendulispora brunnea]|uniref:Alpha-ketoacid dehydrogenase subunit beta n=1 Tax=Pendulispora brunnea TaxID=2905690 RepID=A0ABZ2KUI7_9BACT
MATMVQAIRMALHVGEERLGVTDVFGQDLGPPLGGVFTQSQGIKCSWNSPLDERGIIGCAIGLALAGARPVCEIQFCDYAYNIIDLLKLGGGMYWSSNGQWNLPLVMMTPVGSGIHGSIYHSHSFDATATHIPGWKIVMPSNPRDAYGLMLSAIADPNPVMFLAPKALLRAKALPGEEIPGEPDERALSKMIDAPLGDRSKWTPSWPATPDLFIPIGKASTVRPGRDVTCVAYGRMVPLCKKAADELASDGIDVEVIDLRTLIPYDWEHLRESISRTGRVLFVNEDTEVTNFGEHLLRRTVEELFYQLLAPPRLLAGAFVPGVGLADALDTASVPQKTEISSVLRELARHQP